MALDAAARTHPGRSRTSNEDAWVCRPAAGLFAVIDGLGGEEAGEVAAAIAAQAVSEVPDLPELAGETVLAQALRAARDRILAECDHAPEKNGMGAVATAVRFDDGGQSVSIAHVGDTRVYLVHAGGVRQLTHDHVAEGVAGQKRKVARDLGRRDLRGDWVETSRARVARGDVLVLCSDGLHDVVGAEELARELVRLRGEAGTADAIATRLVGMALSGGGPDNVTVVAVRVGRFRRAAPRRWGELVPRAAGVAVAALAVAAAGYLWSVRPVPGTLPADVVGQAAVGEPAEITVRAASRTTVAAHGALQVTGQRLRGGDWTVSVGGEGALHLDRVVVALERDLTVELAPGAELLLRDVRVESGRVRVIAPAGARVLLEHVRLPGEAALVVEGDAVVSRQDVQVEAAP